MKRRHIINSPRLQELRRKRRNAFWGRAITIILIVGGACAATVYVSRAQIFNIQSIEIKGNKIVDASLIENIARTQMATSYLGLIPKTNILIYPQDEIKESLSKEFRRLTDIQLDLEGGRNLKISVAERVGVYTWCGLEPSPNEKCYFVDKEGFIFEEAPYFSEEVYFKFYGGNFDTNEAGLGNYFNKENFNRYVEFRNILGELGISAVAIHQASEEDGKIILSSKNLRSDNPIINFKTSSNFEEIAANLQTSLETEPLKGDFRKKYANLEYIDLRFGNKVYYRFK